MMEVAIAVVVSLFMFIAVLYIRSELIQHYRIQAAGIIKRGGYGIFRDEYYGYKGFDKMLFDFRKWTFKDFYPELEK